MQKTGKHSSYGCLMLPQSFRLDLSTPWPAPHWTRSAPHCHCRCAPGHCGWAPAPATSPPPAKWAIVRTRTASSRGCREKDPQLDPEAAKMMGPATERRFYQTRATWRHSPGASMWPVKRFTPPTWPDSPALAREATQDLPKLLTTGRSRIVLRKYGTSCGS